LLQWATISDQRQIPNPAPENSFLSEWYENAGFNTRNLIFGIPSIISSLSTDMTLRLATSGNRDSLRHWSLRIPVYLKPNDVVEVVVEEVGTTECCFIL
jgi:2-keto-4-pentenoate hydratase/2-oxohepta-3-ene-1,7-dioic acid hydratase in catechol pathway